MATNPSRAVVLQKRNLALLLGATLLVSYILLLLVSNYRSQVTLNNFALSAFHADAVQESEAVARFFAERRSDLAALVTARELSTYFENKALGMSMEYGLKASLLAIEALFQQLAASRRYGTTPIYSELILEDQHGNVLARAGKKQGTLDNQTKSDIAQPHASQDPRVVLVDTDAGPRMVGYTAYYFKGELAGKIIANVAFSEPMAELLSTGSELQHGRCLAALGKCLGFVGKSSKALNIALWLDETAERLGNLTKLKATTVDGSAITLLTAGVPIAGTTYEFVTFVPSEEVLGRLTPRGLMIGMGLLALLVVAGVLLTFRIRLQNLVLRARVHEATAQRRKLQLTNEELRVEVEKRRQGEKKLNYMAHHDSLTGLPNRTLCLDRLQQAIHSAQRHGHWIAVLFLDLDHFKNINDTLGHPVGDRLLQQVADRLSRSVRAEDTVARQGGDEFIVILDAVEDALEPTTVARKILAALSSPFTLDGHELFVTTSIGISLYPDNGDDVTSLIRNADTAMYQAKDQGRNHYRFYEVELTDSALQRFTLEKNLRRAVRDQEFLLLYQPQIDPHDGRVVGVEALIRWQNAELGMVPPSTFIPLAEESSLIEPIGEWVLETACRQMNMWRKAGVACPAVAVNVSGRQLMNPAFLSAVLRILDATGMSADMLELEITESTIMHSPERAMSTLNELKAHGIAVAIDDFGTGYSSMGHLKRFAVDKLKIDRSFIKDVDSSASDLAIARAIVALGQSLGLTVVAEGVETVDQMEILAAEGCDQMQGYLFSRPVCAESIPALVRAGTKRVSQPRLNLAASSN